MKLALIELLFLCALSWTSANLLRSTHFALGDSSPRGEDCARMSVMKEHIGEVVVID
jgi:hypothetical protein